MKAEPVGSKGAVGEHTAIGIYDEGPPLLRGHFPIVSGCLLMHELCLPGGHQVGDGEERLQQRQDASAFVQLLELLLCFLWWGATLPT